METNESARRPDGVSGNIADEWWCPKCGLCHHGLDCPEDDLTAKPEVNIKIFINNIRYEFCPHCGRIIEKEELS
ncbi:hypothetical protein ES703_85595 [subsurface metagenome]